MALTLPKTPISRNALLCAARAFRRAWCFASACRRAVFRLVCRRGLLLWDRGEGEGRGTALAPRSAGRRPAAGGHLPNSARRLTFQPVSPSLKRRPRRSEEHTSELQSRENLVCRLLLE